MLGATMSYIRCLSKRKMIRGMDGYVMRLMAGVKTRVYEQPGLLSYKILVGKKARLLRVLGVSLPPTCSVLRTCGGVEP